MMQSFTPDWPAPKRVRALQTTRLGGFSRAPFDAFNLGSHVGDDAEAVVANRKLLGACVPSEPVWLEQVHGTNVVVAEQVSDVPHADASVSRQPGTVCVVMTADCLPVLLCDDDGTVVAAVHAGWRGLADGVIELALKAMQVDARHVMGWLGPAIGPQAFEVGDEVRALFVARNACAQKAFIPVAKGKWLADISLLARQRLQAVGVTRIFGGDICTHTDADRFFSYRRDGKTGRMGTFIWLDA